MWVPGSLAYLVPLFVIGVRLLFGASGEPEATAEPATSPTALAQARRRAGSPCPSSASPRLPVEPAAFDLLRAARPGPLPPLAACPARLASPPPAAGRAHRLRRFPRAAGRGHEPGRRAPLDSLARPGGPGVAGGRQRLLHGLPVHGAADARAAMAPAGPELAATVAEQVAGGRPARRLPLGLRGVRPLGQPLVDRLDRPGLLRGRLRHRRLLSRCILLQVCLPDRPVQLRAVARFAAGNQGARTRTSVRRAGPRTASAARDDIPGCELHLYQPRKSSNMDCTFCLDCIHACPHDNVGILAEPPGKALWQRSLPFGSRPVRPAPRPGGPRSWC